MYKNYLFDLDGTLLPMDMQNFTEHYFKSLCKKASPAIGIEPQVLINSVLGGLKAMSTNDGVENNHDVFWKAASSVCGKDLTQYSELFDDYYKNEFEEEGLIYLKAILERANISYRQEKMPLVHHARSKIKCYKKNLNRYIDK